MAEVFRYRMGEPSFTEVLASIERWRHAPVPDDLEAAVEELEAGLRSLEQRTDPVSRLARVGLRMVLGNLHRDGGQRDEALSHYDRGCEESEQLDLSSDLARNEVANLRTNWAICRMAMEAWEGALEDLDLAIALRKELPLDGVPVFRWGLAAGWINRGDALSKLGRPDEAVASYDRGIRELEAMEPTPAVRNRLGIAWSNRGLAWESAADPEAARTSFAAAVSALGEIVDEAQVVTLAAARLHRGRLEGDGDESVADAVAALELARPLERRELAAAEVTLKARHWICRCRCAALEAGQTEGDWIADTTDLVEEGLELERAWARAGAFGLRPIACDLFRLGLRVYRVCQPHFFAEFLLESMDPDRSPGAPTEDPEFQAAAVEALREALRDAANRGVSNAPDSAEREMRILGGLQVVDQWLFSLQQREKGDSRPEL